MNIDISFSWLKNNRQLAQAIECTEMVSCGSMISYI